MRKTALIILFISLLAAGCSTAPPVNLPTATQATNLAPPSATQTKPTISVERPKTSPDMPTPSSTRTPTSAPPVSAEQCQARLKNYLESQGGSDNRFPLEEGQSLGGNPANWSGAQIQAAKNLLGEKHVQDLIGWAEDLKAKGYGVTKVIVGDNRQGLMVPTCPGGGYCWAVDKNGNFLNRMDGIGDPKMAGFKRIPKGPRGSQMEIVQERGCTLLFYKAGGKVVSAFNPLYGQNNTPGQFRGTEPSNREATQTSQAATEQASGSYVDPNYAGYYGRAEITPVSCWKTTPDQSVVKVPDSVPGHFIDNVKGRDGITMTRLNLYGLVLSGCQMDQVHLVDNADISDFYQVKLSFNYRRSNGEIGVLVVTRRLKIGIDDNESRIRPYEFPITLGSNCDLILGGVANGSDSINKRWLKGLSSDSLIKLRDAVLLPFNPNKLLKQLDENPYIEVDPREAGISGIYR